MGAVGPHSWIAKEWNNTPGQQSQASGSSVVGSPTISVQLIAVSAERPS